MDECGYICILIMFAHVCINLFIQLTCLLICVVQGCYTKMHVWIYFLNLVACLFVLLQGCYTKKDGECVMPEGLCYCTKEDYVFKYALWMYLVFNFWIINFAAGVLLEGRWCVLQAGGVVFLQKRRKVLWRQKVRNVRTYGICTSI